MLDTTHNETAPRAWQDMVRLGNVVLFRFPYAEANAPAEAPKARACLVLEVERRDSRIFAELVYGTSVDTAANRGDEIRVDRPEALAAAGLHRPTRFIATRRITVSLDNAGFVLNPRYPSPVLGRLAPADLARMNRVRARIEALRDVAAERRERRSRTATERGVIVERRPSRKALRARIAAAQGRRFGR